MQSFRTILPAFRPNFPIQHDQPWMCIGSCFAESMAQRLKAAKFNCDINPYGILYHPVHITNCLDMICQDYQFTSKDLVLSNDRWYSLYHHSKHSNDDREQLLIALQNSSIKSKAQIAKSDLYIFTFGTAYYYEHIATKVNVANCHKIPAIQFTKKMSTVDEIVDHFEDTLRNLLKINPNAKFIFTVSPIRHIKDGLIENTRSKATLHLAIDTLTKSFNQAHYFPSYEIMMDDLRDYRFYKEDMIHPSAVAVKYIWDHFIKNLFSEETHQLIEKIGHIQQAMRHKPFHPNSEAHQQFVKANLDKIATLKKNNPLLDFLLEENFFKEKISS